MDKYKWLQELQIGDPVIVKNTGFGAFDSVGQVERTTKTQIVVKGKIVKFMKSSGRLAGKVGIYFSWLEQYTKEDGDVIRDANDARRIVRMLKETNWGEVPLEVLQRLADFMRDEGIGK